MKTLKLILSILIFAGLVSCDETSTCPVEYSIDHSNTYSLGGSWKLVGFYKEGSNSIEYPPCKFYSQSTDAKVSIGFEDTPHNLTDSAYINYPYRFGGHATINFYDGVYSFDNSGNFSIGPMLTTEMMGNHELDDYERKYYQALGSAFRFEIQHNILSIYYSATEKMVFVAD